MFLQIIHWVLSRQTCLVCHELAHLLVAVALGYRVSWSNTLLSCWSQQPKCCVPGMASAECHSASCACRHAGWTVSCALAAAALRLWGHHSVVFAACCLTALDAICSDLLVMGDSAPGVFFCGNFGLLLLENRYSDLVPEVLRRMIKVTMVRGAQCGGLVTYVRGSKESRVSKCVKQVNGKRTDLSELLISASR